MGCTFAPCKVAPITTFNFMTRKEFERIQSELKTSGLPIKEYLASVDVAYSTYNYWRKKVEQESQALPIARINIKKAEPSSPTINTPAICGGEAHGVLLAFPNGVRAHFGAGSEKILMEVLNRSMIPDYVLP